jgi:ankyrin repeat protein
VDDKDREGLTALHTAAAAGYNVLVEILISHGADVNACTLDGRTPLSLARQKLPKWDSWTSKTLDALLKHGATE